MQEDRDLTLAMNLPIEEEERNRLRREQVIAEPVTEIQQPKTEHRGAEAEYQSRRIRWQKFRSISRLFESQPSKKTANNLTGVHSLRDVESDFEFKATSRNP